MRGLPIPCRLRSLLVGATVLVQGIAAPGGTHAQPATEDAPAPTLRYRPTRDLPITLSALAISFASDVVGDELDGPSAVGDVDSVFVLDRFVARHAALRPGARTASDVLLLTGVGGGLVASAFTVGGEAGRPRRRARLVRVGLTFEALALTNAMTTLTKLAVRRPRPFTYAADYDPATGRLDDRLSYFSGHTSNTASALGSLCALTFVEPMPRSVRGSVIGASVLYTGTVGALRIRAGKHFPTDVLTGALVGASIGVLVPMTHRIEARLVPDVGAGRAGVALVGALPVELGTGRARRGETRPATEPPERGRT